ncbi:MAG: hypothetical protein ACK58T_19060, partial [Phycisphaerae bacterium]
MSSFPLVLIIRDGWGMNPNPSHDSFNAVKLAKTPVADRLMHDYPWTLIKTSGEDVGLPDEDRDFLTQLVAVDAAHDVATCA